MTKEAAQRSIMRRVALTKVADEYSDMLYGYRNAHRGLVGAGVGVSVNDNMRKQYGRVPPPPPPAGRPARAQAKPVVPRR